MLVASLTSFSEIEQATALADAIEFRLDLLGDVRLTPLPAMYTFRKSVLACVEKFLRLGPAFCDFEADTDPAFLTRIAQKFPNVQFIGSYHNFDHMPDLESVLKKMRHPSFSHYKMAAHASSTLDMLRMMIFAKQHPDVSCIALGPDGKPSRVLGPIVGNRFNYAGIEENRELHRYSLKQLHEIFHFRKLGPNTRIYGLIGDPVEQSPGHLFHNDRFKESDAVYVKMRLKTDELASFFSLIRQLPFSGLSVTMPLKKAVIPFLDRVDMEIGAVNTIAIGDRLIGTNTDAPGALNAIERHFPVCDRRVAILGAGGTALAIAYEAKRRGAIVEIYDRTKIGALQSYDLLINTVPVELGIEPIGGTAVMDVVYTQEGLLNRAREKGCICIHGSEMFFEQAALQQEVWKTMR